MNSWDSKLTWPFFFTESGLYFLHVKQEVFCPDHPIRFYLNIVKVQNMFVLLQLLRSIVWTLICSRFNGKFDSFDRIKWLLIKISNVNSEFLNILKICKEHSLMVCEFYNGIRILISRLCPTGRQILNRSLRVRLWI